jgi:ATP-dependent RNA helicase DDX31/DBP7
LRKERKEGVFASKTFDELEDILHPHLISCVKNKLNLTQMTTVQAEAIPKVLTGKDCLIKSVTGSGKTLAILIPLVQMLQAIEPSITREDGTVALILLPTRELVVQFFEPLALLCSAFNRIVPGVLMGGENKHSEKNRLRKGINILVGTPGRLIDHLETTKSFSLDKLRFLIIDEADRLYESGFEHSVRKVVDAIKEANGENKPQTILASATLTDGVKRLAGMLLEEAEFVDTCDTDDNFNGQHLYTLPENLKQHYCMVPAKLRILTLTGFIFKNCSYEGTSKILVFMSSQDGVDFHHTLFNTILNPLMEKSEVNRVAFFKLHGSMEQSERVQIFNEFRQAKSGVLLCTDVASRGVDLPHVDWILQYSCSPTLEDYVHRVGRTARIDQVGQSIVFILPSEDNYIKLVQKKLKANLSEMTVETLVQPLVALDFSPKPNSRQYREQAGQLQFVYESAIAQDPILGDLAKKAYISHTRSYASYPRALKDILPFKQLHLGHICKSFCLRESPRVLGVSYQPAKPKERSSNGFNRNPRTGKRPLPMEYKTSEFSSGL